MGWPANWEARFASTSLAFMLVLVPEPVWKMSMGNSPSSLPSINSAAARGDQVGLLDRQLAEFEVCPGGGGLDEAQRAQVRTAKAVAADGKN